MKIDINEYFTDVIIEYHGQTFSLDFNMAIHGCWVFYEIGKDPWDEDILRGRIRIDTDRSKVLKKCIDQIHFYCGKDEIKWLEIFSIMINLLEVFQ